MQLQNQALNVSAVSHHQSYFHTHSTEPVLECTCGHAVKVRLQLIQAGAHLVLI